MKKLLGLAACLALSSAPALAQLLPDGGPMSCTNDSQCGDVCGWVCSWPMGHVCVPALSPDGGVNDPGWCTAGAANPGCACAGQTCSGTACTPAFQRQCLCDTDCPSGDICDQSIFACRPTPSATGCNLGEMSCGCFCGPDGSGGTQWNCTGGMPPTTCSVDSDCLMCQGYTCVGGSCVQNYASCLNGAPDGGSSSSSSSSGGSSGSSSSSSSGGSGSSSSSSGGTTGGGSSSGGSTGSASSSGGSSTGGACGLTGQAACTQATEKTDCCSQYCVNNVCHCNNGSGTYPCVTSEDCCASDGATCQNGKCVGSASSSGGSSSGGASTGGTSGAATTGAADGGTSNSKSGCGCGAGGTGGEGLALLALGLGVLVSRRRRS